MAQTKKSLWKFGTREVVFAAIGAALYAVFAYATNMLQIPAAANVSIRPGVVIPLFFGVAFGPIVGFITGFLGNFLADLISGYGIWPWWDLGNGLMGLVPGLVANQMTTYRAIKDIVLAEVMALVGVVVGMGVAAISEMWVSGMDFIAAMTANFVPAFISNAINGLVLLPIIMVAYSAIVKRSGR
jgi:energy-coupling factor transport system substrate-specific component